MTTETINDETNLLDATTATTESDAQVTDGSTAPTTAEHTTEPAESDLGPAGEADASTEDDSKNPSREAAKYRTKLREAETREQTLRTDIRELQSEVVRLLHVGKLQNTADFDQFVGIENVLGEDGRIDREKMDAAVAALLVERPYLAPQKSRPGRPRPAVGQIVTGSAPVASKGTLADKFGGAGDSKWADVLPSRGEATRQEDATRARARTVKLEVGKTVE